MIGISSVSPVKDAFDVSALMSASGSCVSQLQAIIDDSSNIVE